MVDLPLYSSSVIRSSVTRKITSKPREAPLLKQHYAYESLCEGCYSQFSNTVFEFGSEYVLEAAQKWITFPGTYQVKFPLQTILPKVQMIRQVPPKQLPRDVEVDRRRRRYFKVRISDLLVEAGIQINQLIRPEEVEAEMHKVAFERSFFLPLFIFDDETFDSNSISGWLDTGLVENERHPLPAWGLVKKLDGIYSWEMVAVYSYDEQTYLFTVIDLNEARTHDVYRIHLMFMAESPYLFVERIRSALTQRTLCESKIRFQIMLDCVMFEGTGGMDQRLLGQIFKQALVTEKNAEGREIIISSIANEIKLSFQRVMISYVLGDFLNSHKDEFKFIDVPKKVVKPVKKLPFYTTEEHHKQFLKSRKTQRVITLFYVAESIQAMLNAATECAFIENFCLFSYIIPKAVALADFVIAQENNCSTVIKYLKYTWPENLSGKVCICLRSIGKGWLDLTVSDWNVFNVAKISRFFLQIKWRMQESLQILMEKSILNYSRLLNEPCLDFLQLEDDYEWTDDYRTTPFDRLSLPPVFKMVVQINADGPFYSTDPLEFEPTLTKLFYTSLMSTCGIRIIDPDSLQSLDFAKNLFIFTVELIEPMYIEHNEWLHASYSKAVIPLNAYLRKFERFVDFHELVIDEFITDFANAEKSSQEVKNEILYQKDMKEELREILPECLVIGSFQVIVEPIKRYMINKRIEIIRRLFLYYIQRMLSINEQLLEELTEINNRLHEKLVSIEHLFEIKEYMTLVPDKLTVLKERIQIMMMEYGVLDFFFYNLSDMQFGMKWEAFAWPYKINKRLGAMKEEHKIDIEEFKRLQIRELATFQEQLESLNEEVGQFGLQFDPEKAIEVAVESKKTWKIILDLQKTGKLLQDRQLLFESDELSLDYLDSIIESFAPYRALWLACSDLIKLEEIAVGNPLTTVDLNEIRETLAEYRKTMEKSVEIFEGKEEVKNVALVFLQKVEEFYPVLDTIECIKNENWLLMHWQELSQRAGVEIKYSLSMNFAFCMKKGIMNHVELVKEICERAVREADAIRKAMEEEERLRIEAELALLAKKMNRKCRTDIL